MKTIKTLFTICAVALITMNSYAISPKKSNVESNNFEFTYKVKIPQLEGQLNTMELWIPIPQSDNYQKINDVSIDTDYKYSIKKDKQFNNKYLYLKSDGKKGGYVNLTVKASRFERN